MANFQFNFATVAPSVAFKPVPPGWYWTKVVETEVKPTKSGTGQMLVAELEIIDGAHLGRKVFVNFNIKNDNPQAEQIGWSQLSALAHAVNVIQMQDTQQLHNIPFKAKFGIQKGSDGYEDSNSFKAAASQNSDEVVDGGAGAQTAAPTNFGAPAQGQPQAGFGGQPQAQAGFNPGAGQQPAGGAAQGFGQQQQPAQQQPAQAQQGFQPQAAQQQAPAATQQQPAATQNQPAATGEVDNRPPWERG